MWAGLLASAACSGGHAPESQVVATVDGEEITAPELDAVVATSGPTDPANAKAVRREALDRLIIESLLVHKAEQLDLGKKPAVAREIERARRSVLAQAYLARAAASAEPTDTAANRFYASHPYAFAQRRRYALSEIAVAGTPADLAPLIALFSAEAGSLDQVRARLAARGVPAAVEATTIDGDQLPDALAAELAKMVPADKFTYGSDGTQHFVRVDSVFDSPVAFDLARPRIAGRMRQEQSDELGKADIARLRAAAKIDLRPLGRAIEGTAPATPAGAR